MIPFETNPCLNLQYFASDWSQEVLDLCEEHQKDGVVGIDIAGDERLANPTHEGHVKAFVVRDKVFFAKMFVL